MTVEDLDPRPLTYAVDVHRLLEETGTSVQVADTVDVGRIEIGGESFVPLRPASFEVALLNGGAGLVATGSISVAFTAECSRCLDTFELPVFGTVEAFYITPDTAGSVPEEQDYELIAGGHVDLGPALLAAVTIELPFVPLHDPECAGICPECGENLNQGPCPCVPAQTPSPFESLRTLLDDEGGPST